MNVAAVKDQLVLIEAGRDLAGLVPAVVGIAGVNRAYAQAPSQIPDADMPLFMNFAGATMEFVSLGGDLYREKRVFLARLYVARAQQGIDGEAEAKVEPFFPLAQQQFLSHSSLGTGNEDELISGISALEYLGDGGTQILVYQQEQFIGIEFRLAVTEIVEVPRAAYD